MEKKVEISLCMGSSCFTRGNNRLLELLEDQISANGWEDLVFLSGARCQDKCGDGPNVFIDGKLYRGLDEGALLDILQHKLGVKRSEASRSSVRRNTGTY